MEDAVPKFKVGDTVMNKQLGPPTVGVITSVIHPLVYSQLTKPTSLSTYPDQLNYYYYILKLEAPVKIISYQHFKNKHEGTLTESETKRKYEEVPVTTNLGFPEQDLEILE
jgi:hypothetical protein